MADSMRKHMQEITLGLEDDAVTIPIDLCTQAVSVNRFSLIVKPLNPRKQNLRALLNTLPRLWGLNEGFTGRIVESRQVQFLFTSEETLNSILRRGPYSFNDWIIDMTKWNPQNPNTDAIWVPFWIQILGIPLQYLSHSMITHIGKTLGHFMETDFERDGSVLVDYVRVRVLWHTLNPLKFQRLFQFDEDSKILKFRYEKLRNFCTLCGLMSHEADTCPSQSEQEDDPSEDHDNGNADDDNDDPNGEDLRNLMSDIGDSTIPTVATTPLDKPSSSTKRRRDNDTASSPQHSHTDSSNYCCTEKHKSCRLDDSDVSFTKRMRHRLDCTIVRNWFVHPSAAANTRHGTFAFTNSRYASNSNGTVGQKPPEQQ